MFDKPRKTKTLQVLDVLSKRMSLPTHFHATYKRLHQGYLGELYFFKLLQEQLQSPCIQLYGLQLKINGSECQIDVLLIFQNDIYQIDVKNFQGDYYIENNRWHFVNSKKEIRNPLHQLTRSDLLLREFLTEHSANFTLKSSITFVHPGFQLYQAPLKTPIIFASQLERYIRSLQNLPCQLDTRHHKIAEAFTTAHLLESSHEQIPSYDYDQLKRGIFCALCNGLMYFNNSRRFECTNCKSDEESDTAVIRTIHEYRLLFPERKITISSIEEWCDCVVSKSTTARILKKYLSLNKKGKYSYYTLQ